MPIQRHLVREFVRDEGGLRSAAGQRVRRVLMLEVDRNARPARRERVNARRDPCAGRGRPIRAGGCGEGIVRP